LGGSLGLGVLVAVFAGVSAGANTGTADVRELLAHRISAALTGSTVMLAIALILVLLLIVWSPTRAGALEPYAQKE